MVCAGPEAWGKSSFLYWREWNGYVCCSLILKADGRSFDCSKASWGNGTCPERRAWLSRNWSTFGNLALRACTWSTSVSSKKPFQGDPISPQKECPVPLARPRFHLVTAIFIYWYVYFPYNETFFKKLCLIFHK